MSKMISFNNSKKLTNCFDKSTQVRDIDFVILHHIEADSAKHALDQLEEHRVSAHFLIDENGEIFELVAENDVAYHAGISYWKGFESLNKNSIGIEFINSNPLKKKFEKAQMKSGLELCHYLMKKYRIEQKNVIGHSDIAYSKITNLPNRKQDPSHLFDWKFLAQNNVGIFPNVSESKIEIFKINDKSPEIKTIKIKLKKLGYRVINLNNEFDAEMESLTLVFNRKFLGKELNAWTEKSGAILDLL